MSEQSNSETQTFKTFHTSTAQEFWQLLSPEKSLVSSSARLLFRGQADERWNLVPSVLRDAGALTSERQVLKEWAYLEMFVRHCDALGLQIPHDSAGLREKYLSLEHPQGPAGAAINTGLWPPSELYPLMALAQHYGIPTRLLDWSTRSHVAAYFAVSDALATDPSARPERLAVWVMDISQTYPFHTLTVLKLPGSNNANLAAQSGRFTLLSQEGWRGTPFEGEIALDRILCTLPTIIPLHQVTLPISEAYAVLGLCNLYAVNGAAMFPGYSGAARATRDDMSRTLW